jgi:DNA adenine methylase
MTKIFVPPIKCQGIKTKLVPWILEQSKFNEKGIWLEPFMGSGVVGFNAKPKNALFSDLNLHIINFYNALKKSAITPELAKKYLQEEGKILSKKGEAHFYFIRDRFNKHNDPLDFLFLSRSCFNGMIRFNKKGFFNVPFCHKPDRFSKSYITKIVNQIKYVFQSIKLNNWIFETCDFSEMVKSASAHDFIYCDPPYYGRHVDYYNSWSDEDEEKLFECLKRSKAKFVLSTWHSNKYRTNPSIEKHWSEFHIITKAHFYHVGANEKNRHAMVEALILNFSPESKRVSYSQKSEQLALLESKVLYNKKSLAKRLSK